MRNNELIMLLSIFKKYNVYYISVINFILCYTFFRIFIKSVAALLVNEQYAMSIIFMLYNAIY